eukprot:TRINITY_DN22495_c0_g1_i1.p1 TRINITY_DN22495_c0_g1~~TRINITY_DN22495_c0_g1_i1.p1  ORF type:complete len:383 (+),score=37.38 TRINITY_DN22495_c0_g1_i1:179-1327(+)
MAQTDSSMDASFDPTSRQSLEDCLAQAAALLEDTGSPALTAEQRLMYKEQGWVILRAVVPRNIASVIREQIIHPGLKLNDRPIDPDDATTWGRGGDGQTPLSMLERIVTALGSESSYYGERTNYKRGLDPSLRKDIDEPHCEQLQKLWAASNQLASKHLKRTVDQLVGPGEWNDKGCAAGEVLNTGLHLRYGLPSKDNTRRREECKWPLIGWHVDGAHHRHALGLRVVEKDGKTIKPAFACIGMIAWNQILPHGGITGVMPGSHRRMLSILRSFEDVCRLPNWLLLVRQSLFGGCVADPIAEANDEQVLHPGDVLLMHPYLTHSSAWNFMDNLRIASHVQFHYNSPMDRDGLAKMAARQVAGQSANDSLPLNTELLLEVLGE